MFYLTVLSFMFMCLYATYSHVETGQQLLQPINLTTRGLINLIKGSWRTT